MRPAFDGRAIDGCGVADNGIVERMKGVAHRALVTQRALPEKSPIMQSNGHRPPPQVGPFAFRPVRRRNPRRTKLLDHIGGDRHVIDQVAHAHDAGLRTGMLQRGDDGVCAIAAGLDADTIEVDLIVEPVVKTIGAVDRVGLHIDP